MNNFAGFSCYKTDAQQLTFKNKVVVLIVARTATNEEFKIKGKDQKVNGTPK